MTKNIEMCKVEVETVNDDNILDFIPYEDEGEEPRIIPQTK